MRLSVAGQPTQIWCPVDSLKEFPGAWETAGEHTVVCAWPGVYLTGGAIHIVLPRCYATAKPEVATTIRAALTFIGVLRRYRDHPERRAVDESTGETSLAELGGFESDALAWLEVALLLERDATESGPLYVVQRSVSPRHQGRIHWHQTQQRGFHVVDGAEVMSSPLWRARTGINPDDELTQLHGSTIQSIRAVLGLGPGNIKPFGASDALSILNRREPTLFTDRHRRVARWLRQYWGSPSGRGDTHRVRSSAIWSPAFPLVWEEMLRQVLHGRRMEPPRGTYRLHGGTQAGLRLIPDFTVRQDGVLWIVDAKHYAITAMPGTASLAKQLLYRWLSSIESGFGEHSLRAIRSLFVMPSVEFETPFTILGNHELAGDNDENHHFGQVWVIAVNFEHVARRYISATASDEYLPGSSGVLSSAGLPG
jgi:hypothetical protein